MLLCVTVLFGVTAPTMVYLGKFVPGDGLARLRAIHKTLVLFFADVSLQPGQVSKVFNSQPPEEPLMRLGRGLGAVHPSGPCSMP